MLDPEADSGAAMLRLFAPMLSGAGFATGKLDLPFRQWVRIQMDLSLPSVGTATGSAASLSVDGGPPVQITTNITSISTFGLTVGFDFVGTGNGDAYIDNLACDSH